jgi:hypothetical protein
MNHDPLSPRAESGAHKALEALGVVGGALIVYLAVGILLEAFTGLNVPFISWS